MEENGGKALYINHDDKAFSWVHPALIKSSHHSRMKDAAGVLHHHDGTEFGGLERGTPRSGARRDSARGNGNGSLGTDTDADENGYERAPDSVWEEEEEEEMRHAITNSRQEIAFVPSSSLQQLQSAHSSLVQY